MVGECFGKGAGPAAGGVRVPAEPVVVRGVGDRGAGPARGAGRAGDGPQSPSRLGPGVAAVAAGGRPRRTGPRPENAGDPTGPGAPAPDVRGRVPGRGPDLNPKIG